jgi:hypothetical protein
MAAATVVSLILQLYLKWNTDDPRDFAYLMLVTVAVTTAVWLIVTLFTSPEPIETLVAFYFKVRPEGRGWKPVAETAGLTGLHQGGGIAIQLANWVLGCILIYSSLFGIGKLIFKEWAVGTLCVLIAVGAAALISRNISRMEWNSLAVDESDLELKVERSAI